MCIDTTVKVFWSLTGCRRAEARDSTPCKTQPESLSIILSGSSCVVEDLVVKDEAPVGGVAQVIGHGVIGRSRTCMERKDRDEDGEVQGRGKRRSRANQRETLIMDGMDMG